MWTAAAPVDAQNAPNRGLEISHRTRDSHSVHIDHRVLERKRRTKNTTTQINCPRNRISLRSRVTVAVSITCVAVGQGR